MPRPLRDLVEWVPEYTVSKNFYNISWSIFGNIVTEKWDRNEGLWIERQ